jgi:uncharacterized protein YndB with AHSA1/START domain
MNLELDPNTDLSFTRTLAVPRELVWECWTKPEHIRNFFVPAPHKVTAVDIDVRVGGRFNTTFLVEGNVMDNKGVYLDVVPGERLVFTDAYTEGWKPAPDPFMTALLLLEDTPDGGTSYTAIARHRNADTRKAHEDMGFFGGWGTVATQLEAYAKGLMK